ncbi:MAG TPA: ferritin-like domain-containing protein [Tepidisphaeraceae bacterium]|jgi:hypothetical protein|nr:ferritin-like domain-containing protein [Tepidisphaeraceae bacterium]
MSLPLSSSIVNPVEQSRRAFLRRSTALAIAGGSAALIASSLTSRVHAAEKEETASPSGQGSFFKSIQKHEHDHVAFLLGALGKAARPKPNFHRLEMSSFNGFANTAQALENTGVGAYLGALPAIFNHDYTADAGSIALIEARHAGYLNTYLGDPITANAEDDDTDNSFEKPLSAKQVVALASNFIKDLNGGPPLTYSATPSAKNDVVILNFALALEYLENEFYNLNVPKFFK